MALVDTTWYANFGDGSTTGYYAVTVRPQNTAVAAGILRRQFTAPAVGSERVYVCIVAGTTANVTDATWVLTRGAKTTDGTATWQECTGQASLNGDLTNTTTWAAVKAATPAVLGQIIKRSNNASYQICTTAGAMSASEPTFSDTAGVTTTDTTAVWTSLGVVGNFTGGQAPFARLASAGAANWFAAGNTIYVGDNHAEAQSTAISLGLAISTGSATGRVICHNHSGSYPPSSTDITTGATITTTAAVGISFTSPGAFYFYGLTFKAGVGASSGGGNSVITLGANTNGSGQNWHYFDNCSFWLSNTAVLSYVVIGATNGVGTFVYWNNCTIKCTTTASTGVSLGNLGSSFIWQNTGPVLVSGSAIPNPLITPTGSLFGSAILEAVDLSQITGAIVYGANYFYGAILLKDCKLNAAGTIQTPSNSGATVQLVRCDSGATGYKSARYLYEGIETTETSITRVGGAVDPASQAQSRKIVTTANAQWLRPFKAEPYASWNAVTGSNVTVTVYGTINAGTLPNNDDIWVEAEYISDSSFPLGKIVTSTKSNLLAANAAVASDGSSWNTTALPFTFDPATIGPSATLSNGNLTITRTATGVYSGARFPPSITTNGKFYFEATVVATHGTGDSAGVAQFDATYLNVSQAGTFCAVTYFTNGNIWSNGGNTGKTLGAVVAGDVIGIAVDLTTRLGWLRKNAGNWNGDVTHNPATGVGGVAITAATAFSPIVAFSTASGSIGDAVTANFGATTYANSAPSGFVNWSLWSPFKLTTTLSSPQPAMAGYVHARVRVGKASTTYYIDPMVTLS